jgi:hypothetical protein
MMPIKINKFPFSPEELREVLDYNNETGKFTWTSSHYRPDLMDKEAGCLNSSGYRYIRLKGVRYPAHRLAWYYIYGVEPKEQIDHINGAKDDNRISNLREATWVENMRNIGKRSNNTSGFKGVSLKKSTKKFVAQCSVNGKSQHLGFFPTAEAAHAAYVAFATKEHGDFANIN